MSALRQAAVAACIAVAAERESAQTLPDRNPLLDRWAGLWPDHAATPVCEIPPAFGPDANSRSVSAA